MRVLRFALIALFFTLTLALSAQEECMDCTERWVEQEDGSILSDGLCCDALANGTCTGGFEMKDENVGWGCQLSNYPPNSTVTLPLPMGGTAEFDVEGSYCTSATVQNPCGPGDPPGGEDTEEIPDPVNNSPILINLERGPYRLAALSDPALFDIDADGNPEWITWTERDGAVALLALDRDGNGRIDNGAELFGNHTPLRSGAIALNGFEALAELDSNSDGLVNSGDRDWNHLRLWIDRNHYGASTTDELLAIASTEITALETTFMPKRKEDRMGNAFRYKGWAQFGHEPRAIWDVYFVRVP